MYRCVVVVVVAVAALLAVAAARPTASDPPTQIHLAQGSFSGGTSMVVSWLTNTTTQGIVNYGTASGVLTKTVPQTIESYRYNFTSKYTGFYQSGLIHHIVITSLLPGTRYYYVVGYPTGGMSSEFSFITPSTVGANVPYVFGVIGDLGQTNNSLSTVQHVLADPTMTMTLLIGDLSYADSAWDPVSLDRPCTQKRWDSWGNMVQPMTATQPLMILPGNHEVEQEGAPPATQTPFLAYQSRFLMPSVSSGAVDGNLYYSFEVASAHVIMLNSYMDYSPSSNQYKWLLKDLASVDRSRTPWLIAAMHAPWYNSNQHHHDEAEETGMRETFEAIFYQNKVDLIFSGHVHAYERMFPVFKNATTPGAPTFINIGDGGNREGPCPEWYEQPSWSAFRGNSFGHGRFEIFNSTHAYWSWHTVETPETTVSDKVYFVRTALNQQIGGVTAFGVGKSAQQYDGVPRSKIVKRPVGGAAAL